MKPCHDDRWDDQHIIQWIEISDAEKLHHFVVQEFLREDAAELSNGGGGGDEEQDLI